MPSVTTLLWRYPPLPARMKMPTGMLPMEGAATAAAGWFSADLGSPR